jgi:hypothetical protein
MEAFNKILAMGLAKVCCTNHDDWDEGVLTVLWAYRNNTKQLNRYTPFQLVYGREVVVPAKFLTPSVFIVKSTEMIDHESIVA